MVEAFAVITAVIASFGIPGGFFIALVGGQQDGPKGIILLVVGIVSFVCFCFTQKLKSGG